MAKPDTNEIERRQRQRRREPLTDYLQGILNARSGIDRRSPEQIERDNVNVAHWMRQFNGSRVR